MYPAQSLIEWLTREELIAFARKHHLQPRARDSKKQVIAAITSRCSLNEISSSLLDMFPKRRSAGHDKRAGEIRLDRAARLCGTATIHVYSQSNPGLGRILLEHTDSCIVLRVGHTQLLMENRWPLIAADAEPVPLNRLFAAFVRRGRIHPEAGAPPPAERPFIIDEGVYGLRDARLRFEMQHSGPLSFKVLFMRYGPRSGRPEYILRPIA